MGRLGLVLAVEVTAASTRDRDAAVPLLERLYSMHFSTRLVRAGGGCAGRLVDWAAGNLRLTLKIVRRTDDTTGFVVLPRGWVVDGTLSWLLLTAYALPARFRLQSRSSARTTGHRSRRLKSEMGAASVTKAAACGQHAVPVTVRSREGLAVLAAGRLRDPQPVLPYGGRTAERQASARTPEDRRRPGGRRANG